jgi:hypothetical protein
MEPKYQRCEEKELKQQKTPFLSQLELLLL